jgi:hypothetical protein
MIYHSAADIHFRLLRASIAGWMVYIAVDPAHPKLRTLFNSRYNICMHLYAALAVGRANMQAACFKGCGAYN